MKNINQLILTILILIGISCQKINYDTKLIDNPILEDGIYKEQMLSEFAIILSEVVSENKDIRDFIYAEALQQFDNDYDVFYPYVKDKIIGDKTFREVLLTKTDDATLSKIEHAIPTLTILVPDFSWVDSRCFSIKNWDTSNDTIFVGIDESDKVAHKLYSKGLLIGEIPSGTFPESPVLIVKANERVIANVKTKSGETTYSFVHPCFDRNLTKVSTWEGDFYNPEPAVNLVSEDKDYISSSELMVLSPSTISAYNEFGLCTGAGVHRDYIFYGMTNSNTNNGQIDRFKKDMLYRFHLKRNALFSVADDSMTDPSGINSTYYTGRDDRPEFEVCDRIWGGGKYEIKIRFFHLVLNQSVAELAPMVFSISPGDLMYVKKIHDVFQWNFWGNNWSAYTINPEDVEPKWFYPGEHDSFMCLEHPWTLSDLSDNLWVKIQEIDKEATYQIEETMTYKHSASTSFEVNASGDISVVKLQLGVSGTYGNETTSVQKVMVTYTEQSDDLGDVYVNYVDNVVTSKETDKFSLKRYDTGMFGFTLLPVDIRDEYVIRNYMNNRRN